MTILRAFQVQGEMLLDFLKVPEILNQVSYRKRYLLTVIVTCLVFYKIFENTGFE